MVLFIGNIPTKDKRSIGGASTLNYNLLVFLKRNGANVKYYPLRKNWRPKFQLLDYIFFLLKCPFILYKYDTISMHATRDFRVVFGPFIIILAKIFHKKTVCHFYGGFFHKKYSTYPKWFRFWLRKTIFKADLILLETKEQVSFFELELNNSKNIIWFPNARKKQKKELPKEFSRSFVFISRVTEQKGIKLLVEVIEKLPEEYSLDVYGPIDDSKGLSVEYFNKENVSYKGVLSPNKVIPTLSKYDVLILPTLHVNEGYPGIVIEAISCGKPVISSNLVSLSEIIENEKDGILINQGKKDELLNAILFFNTVNYKTFSKNARDKFQLFDEDIVFDKLLNFYNKN